MIYLGVMYVETTKALLCIKIGGEMLVGKEKSYIYQSKDNMIL